MGDNDSDSYSDSDILQTLTTYTQSVKSSTSPPTPIIPTDIPFDDALQYFEVADRSISCVKAAIEKQLVIIAKSIHECRGFCFTIPSRSSSNQMYIPLLGRMALGKNTFGRHFSTSIRKCTIIVRILGIIHQLCVTDTYITKRQLFYKDLKLFKKQRESDAALDDICYILDCCMSNLNIIAADESGVVVGKLTFTDKGDMIDCTRMGSGGKAIPPLIARVRDIQSDDALFILLVAKDSVFTALAENRFYNRFPCIIITSKGHSDVATRLFLRKLKFQLKIPVLALVDSDPYGLQIMSVYGGGSKNMAYDGSLTCPDIKWLGLRPSDIDKYKIPDQFRMPLSEHDLKIGKALLDDEFVKEHPRWITELELMMKSKQKVDIEALMSLDSQHLTNVFLPQKLQQLDWF